MSWKICKVFEFWPFRRVQDFCARPIIKRVLTCKIFEKLFGTLKRIETLKGKKKRVCKIKGVNL